MKTARVQLSLRQLARWTFLIWIGTVCPAATSAQSSETVFTISPSLVHTNGSTLVSIAIGVPAHHHVYAERLSFEWNGETVSASLPPARRVPDKFSGEEKEMFENDFVATLPVAPNRSNALVLAVNFQGCSESECYFPETRKWKLNPNDQFDRWEDPAEVATADGSGLALTNGFSVAGRASGYLSSEKLLRFLEESRSGTWKSGDELTGVFQRLGGAAVVGLILLGGLALNLTPCVLPMIPINLAILGAGSRNQSRRRSVSLGLAYGGGMAIAYGALGLVVVLTGSKFGTLNSSPWFNFVIAAVFIVLGLAMFDKIAIDFSRFQRAGGKPAASNAAVLAAVAMGSFSALLAGACVAPVVISVLLLATTFYQHGNWVGLLLPFVLGMGMALPWPFAAAGLSFLPKPGAWMTRVKYGFGVIIFGFALWYGWLGWNLLHPQTNPQSTIAQSSSVSEIQSALEQSKLNGKPVFIDFWASWCKNCEAMEHSTFRDPTVQHRLSSDFISVRFQAEKLNDPAVRPVLDQFGVMGLPTCVVLLPGSAEKSHH